MAWPLLSLETGGRTPNASQVRNITFCGWLPVELGSWFGMWWMGYETRPFWVFSTLK